MLEGLGVFWGVTVEISSVRLSRNMTRSSSSPESIEKDIALQISLILEWIFQLSF